MKKSLISILFFTIITCCFGFDFNFKPEKPDFFVSQQFGYNFFSNIKQDSLASATVANADFDILKIDFGLQGIGSKADITAQIAYIPQIGTINVGPVFTYHFNHISQTINESDFLLGLQFYTPISKYFEYYMDANFLFKVTSIENITTQPNNQSFKVAFRLNYFPTDSLTITARMESSTFFNYYLFVTPIFTLGTEYSFLDRFCIGANIEATFIDMFTISANLSQLTVNTFFKIRVN